MLQLLMVANYKSHKVKQAVLAWKNNTAALEKINNSDIQNLDTINTLHALSELFEHAVNNFPPENSSGLIEQQALFMKMRNKSAHEITS